MLHLVRKMSGLILLHFIQAAPSRSLYDAVFAGAEASTKRIAPAPPNASSRPCQETSAQDCRQPRRRRGGVMCGPFVSPDHQFLLMRTRFAISEEGFFATMYNIIDVARQSPYLEGIVSFTAFRKMGKVGV